MINEEAYINLVKDILADGEARGDRTGTGTFSLFGKSLEFDLQDSFPAITTKKLFWKGVVAELLWFLKGSNNIQYLLDNDVHIWDEWADENGDVGPIYGVQWRDFGGVDQIEEVVSSLRNNPESRRHLVSAWNASEINKMALPPCHVMFQFYVSQGKYLECQMYQRSADVFLGVPFNIASYALLTHIIAAKTDLIPSKLKIVFGDCHIYSNHVDQAMEMISREILPPPRLAMNLDSVASLDFEQLSISDFSLVNYESHPPIKAPIAV